MSIVIAGYDGEGNLLEGEALREWENGIKNELVRALSAHKLTVGKSVALLNECAAELTETGMQTLVGA